MNEEVPEHYVLYQNYPNPFNPATTIQFDVDMPSLVTIKVYNMLGQELATLLDRETIEDESGEVVFDASRLASGVYFYRMVAEPLADEDDDPIGQTHVIVKKMILMK